MHERALCSVKYIIAAGGPDAHVVLRGREVKDSLRSAVPTIVRHQRENGKAVPARGFKEGCRDALRPLHEPFLGAGRGYISEFERS